MVVHPRSPALIAHGSTVSRRYSDRITLLAGVQARQRRALATLALLPVKQTGITCDGTATNRLEIKMASVLSLWM
ncbi:hypothetical protein PMIN01_03456 [Paraphaeosphaeria minitans]|uniref:Uncharacterized protein n=1 Tax=Paraphaeosphaeria minitans TaxID=565426 RepID=A0A9P6KSU1_9PLEO|nr:hypothetical protein PMIN01_03456 [Paraphaeosphaeria minitans]